MRDLGLMPSAARPIVNQAARLAAIRVRMRQEQKLGFLYGENLQLYHNGTLYSGGNYYLAHNNLLATTVGTTQYKRIGDSVYFQKVDMKVWLSNKLDRPNVMYRIVVIAGEENDMPDGTSIVSPQPVSGVEYSASGPSTMLVKWNRDKFKIIRDFYVQPFGGDYSLESGATNKEHSRLIEFSIPINKNIKYKADSGTVPEGANCYGFFITVYDAYGSVATNNIASFAWQATQYYKDP